MHRVVFSTTPRRLRTAFESSSTGLTMTNLYILSVNRIFIGWEKTPVIPRIAPFQLFHHPFLLPRQSYDRVPCGKGNADSLLS
jgi:hypothetical protein